VNRTPAEILDDIVVLCGKVFADHEELEKVYVVDLVGIRDGINELRSAVGSGNSIAYFIRLATDHSRTSGPKRKRLAWSCSER
jgi:hypothetical protein